MVSLVPLHFTEGKRIIDPLSDRVKEEPEDKTTHPLRLNVNKCMIYW